jgi:hypothetical protein
MRAQTELAIAEAVERMEQAEARAEEAEARNLGHDARAQAMAEDLAIAKKELAERESELEEARVAHREARKRWKQESEAALAKAQQEWKASEAARIAASESQGREQSDSALAKLGQQLKETEAELAQAREQIETLRRRGDSDDFRRLRDDFAALQAQLARRDAELAQLRSDHEIDRERWTAEARRALQRADQSWKAEDGESIERREHAEARRRMAQGVATLAFLAVIGAAGYVWIGPMLSRNTEPLTSLLQPILNQAQSQIDTPVNAVTAPEKPLFTVVHGVNLRAGPSASAKVIGSLPRNAKAPALERRGGWVKVDIPAQGDKPRLEGWVYGAFLKEAGPDK